MKSRLLVFIQFSIIFLMSILLKDGITFSLWAILSIVVGIAVGIAGIYKNNFGNFNIRPDIKEDCTLVTDGIYSYIRHPMYLSVLLSMFGVLLLHIDFFTIVLYIILIINMIIKMLYEESLWHVSGDEYRAYTKKTARMIPYIF